MLRTLLPALLILLATAPALPAREPAPPVQVLLVTGMNNHDWKGSTPVYKAILESGGRLAVTVTTDFAAMAPADLERFGLIVSNFNTFTSRKKPPRDPKWSPELRQAYIEFVRRGKGHLAVHAGSSSFYNWPEYQDLVIGAFKIGTTSHGRQHPFPVRLDAPDHPILRGLAPFHIVDELWHAVPWKKEGKVLASAFSAKESGGSGRWEPVAVVRKYGKGRSCTLLLGHDGRLSKNPAFGELLRRCALWAATGRVEAKRPAWWPASPAAARAAICTPIKAVAALMKYEPGQDRTQLQVVTELTRFALHDPTNRFALPELLAAFLRFKEGTVHFREFLCHQLALIGTDAEVPALGTLLHHPHLAMAARGALEAMPGEAAKSALRTALDTAKGLRLVGLVQSVGLKGDEAAVVKLIQLTDPTKETALRREAITSLGRIASPPAIAHLVTILKQEGPDKVLIARMLLDYADRELAKLRSSPPSERMDIHKHLLLIPTRCIASFPALLQRLLAGFIRCHPQGLKAGVAWAFQDKDDTDRQRAVLLALQAEPKMEGLRVLLEHLETLAPSHQPAAIHLVGKLESQATLPILSRLAASPHPAVRNQVFLTLGATGDAKAVPILLKACAKASKEGQRSIVDALVRLQGKGVDRALIAVLTGSDEAQAVLAIRTLANRRTRAALPALEKLVADPRGPVAKAAAKAVRGLTGLRWQQGKDFFALHRGGDVLWRFRFDERAGKPYFDHLAPVGVPTNLLALRPADHPWHYGLWLSWKYINMTNFWEEDRRTGRSAGTTAWDKPTLVKGQDMAATIRLDLRYHLPGKPPLLTETREIRIAPPRPDGAIQIDWRSVLTAGNETVTLDCTPTPDRPGGRINGGYAGLSARLALGLGQRQILGTGNEPYGFKRNRHRSRRSALDFSGILEGQAVGLAIFDHPANPVHPTPWYVVRSKQMTFFTPALLAAGPRTLDSGDSLTLTWRILAHRGRMTTPEIQKQADAFAKEVQR